MSDLPSMNISFVFSESRNPILENSGLGLFCPPGGVVGGSDERSSVV